MEQKEPLLRPKVGNPPVDRGYGRGLDGEGIVPSTSRCCAGAGEGVVVAGVGTGAVGTYVNDFPLVFQAFQFFRDNLNLQPQPLPLLAKLFVLGK